MAAQATHHAPSGRFIKVYLLTWGLLAAAGLVYLASLAWFPEMLAPPKQQTAEADHAQRNAERALIEVAGVRRSVADVQKDVGRLRDAFELHESQERAAQARLAALEERVTTITAAIPPPQPAPTSMLPAKQLKTPKVHKAEPRAPTRLISVTEQPAAEPSTGNDAKPQPAPIDAPGLKTGSIATRDAAPAPAITFGAAEVKPAVAPAPSQTLYAVQLAAGPSLDSLRLSWNLLLERHGAALGSLRPRFVAPRTEGGPYRLVAGPLPNKIDADKVCDAMGVGRNGCFSTPYVGEPL
jgi:hypothetical protein